MIIINLNNAEEILFFNKNIRESLPEFQQIFRQWDLAKTNLLLRNIAKKAVSNLLESLSEQDLIKISNILGDYVTLDNLDSHIVKNIILPLEIAEEELNKTNNFNNFSISRGQDKIYVSFWRSNVVVFVCCNRANFNCS